MARPVIAVDVDEVLGAFVEALCLFHNKHHGTALSPRDFHSYHFADVTGFGSESETHAKILAFFSSPEFESLSPLVGARDVLLRHSSSFDFVVVTSRSDTLEERTRRWLDVHYPGVFAGVNFTNAYGGKAAKRTKGEVCMELGAVALIDDSLAYAVEAASRLPLTILHGEYAWNDDRHAQAKALPGNVVRAGSWAHLDAILGRLAAALAAGPDVSSAVSRLLHSCQSVEVAGLGPVQAAEAVLTALEIPSTVLVRGFTEELAAGLMAAHVVFDTATASSGSDRPVSVSRGPAFVSHRFLSSPTVSTMAAGEAATPLARELSDTKQHVLQGLSGGEGQ